jgi:hypothetical protein
VSHVNIVKKIKVDGEWKLLAIPRNGKGNYDWNALPEGLYLIESRALRGVIQEVSPNPLRVTQDTPNDPEFPRQWRIDAIGCRASWDRQTDDPSVVIGIIDSGVEMAHPDLIGALMPGRSFVDVAGTPAPDGWRWEGTLSPGLSACR